MIQDQLYISDGVINSMLTEASSTSVEMPASSRAAESRKAKIIAGIPAYNEERFIVEIVQRAKKYADEVIVVDDGSTDHTAQRAEAAGATVIIHEVNKGAGAATESCFSAARLRDADILITLDGDGQHDPDEIAQVAVPALLGEADVVIGSRFIADHRHMPVYRKLGINIINWLFNIGCKTVVHDTQSCFRAYGKKAIQSLSSNEQGFGFSVDLLIQSREKRLNITEVPISCIYHSASHTANPITHGFGVAFTVIKLRLKNTLSLTTSATTIKPTYVRASREAGAVSAGFSGTLTNETIATE
ncbi:MAG: glycosyltransferase family 2 protein [Planctomycetes bacterium]|nr:glycosyltransferase family 2 protein [Planctomycetota bacterium]